MKIVDYRRQRFRVESRLNFSFAANFFRREATVDIGARHEKR
jgi:hypothetical protein